MMHTRTSKILSLALSLVFAAAIGLVAQEKTDKKDDGVTRQPDGSYKSKSHDESNRPDDNYLAKFKAQEIVEKLIKTNLEEIYLLKVIATNFGDKGWKTDYEKCYNGYKEGMEFYYKRNLIYAREKLEKNRADIHDLMKKIIEEFRKEAETMLSECATKVLLLHLDAASRTDPNRYETLHQNHLRLKIGYAQVDDAQSNVYDKYWVSAIYHLRVAKSYGIMILEDLAKPEERDSIKNKYKVTKADNMNRIFAAESTESKTQPAK